MKIFLIVAPFKTSAGVQEKFISNLVTGCQESAVSFQVGAEQMSGERSELPG